MLVYKFLSDCYLTKNRHPLSTFSEEEEVKIVTVENSDEIAFAGCGVAIIDSEQFGQRSIIT